MFPLSGRISATAVVVALLLLSLSRADMAMPQSPNQGGLGSTHAVGRYDTSPLTKDSVLVVPRGPDGRKTLGVEVFRVVDVELHRRAQFVRVGLEGLQPPHGGRGAAVSGDRADSGVYTTVEVAAARMWCRTEEPAAICSDGVHRAQFLRSGDPDGTTGAEWESTEEVTSSLLRGEYSGAGALGVAAAGVVVQNAPSATVDVAEARVAVAFALLQWAEQGGGADVSPGALTISALGGGDAVADLLGSNDSPRPAGEAPPEGRVHFGEDDVQPELEPPHALPNCPLVSLASHGNQSTPDSLHAVVSRIALEQPLPVVFYTGSFS